MERLDQVPKLNWWKLIMNHMFKNMEKASNSVRRRERIGSRVTEYIPGCTIVLNVSTRGQ